MFKVYTWVYTNYAIINDLIAILKETALERRKKFKEPIQ